MNTQTYRQRYRPMSDVDDDDEVTNRAGAVVLRMRDGLVSIQALPARVDLALYAGDDFTMAVTVKDPLDQAVDLATAEVRSHIRAVVDATEFEEFYCTIDQAESNVDMHLASEVSAVVASGSVYDLELTLEGRVTTLIAGTITITPEVTRNAEVEP